MIRTRVHYQKSGERGQHEEFWYLIDNGEDDYDIEYRWSNLEIEELFGGKRYPLLAGLKKAPPEAATIIKQLLTL